MQFLYDDGELLQFMDTTTYEQEGLTYEQVGDAFDWIIDGMQVDMMYFNGKAITVEPPMIVELKLLRLHLTLKVTLKVEENLQH